MSEKTKIAQSTFSALKEFNSSHNKQWDFGTNWNNVSTQFETFINKFLFPKINSTDLINVELGNRFDWLAKEVDFIAQYSEEYVIMDSVPVNLNLSKESELVLKRNYPKMATKLYKQGLIKKQKFTLNNNDNRLNFSTLGDAISYALAVYRKKLSDINVSEEKEIKAMLVDYALNVCKETRTVVSMDDVYNQVFNAILNIQNNSDKYNESNLASGGNIGRYTTNTSMENIAILTTDKIKTYLLNTQLANTFQVAGIDITDRIISFDDLGGVYKVLEKSDETGKGGIEITSKATVEYFNTFGDYQIAIGDVVPFGSTITFDISELEEFKGSVEEVAPTSDMFAYIFDINKLKYRRYTKDMLKEPFYNGETDEITYWLHYYSFKSVSPFYNSIRIGE